ncbi:hypothetical protein Pint_33695 [Pistacia integerrima]|uniref:Uncharacterized protein n=1 Tax=Pistacia integerrima TaxID=434235 RepID=A0ACC0X3F7_9ROSI|nr:hypothetical protein Pint_33695 [Pistacia integerrima]
MAPNRIVLKAFKAMKAIGISENKAKPVLQKLLKLYEKNWKLIEEENYRALADASFEEEDANLLFFVKCGLVCDVSEQKKAKIVEQGEIFEEEPLPDVEPLRPLKRLRRGQEVPATPFRSNSSPVSGASLLRRPKLKEGELPSTSMQQQSQDETKALQLSTGNVGADTPCLTYNGKEPVLPIIAFTENSCISERASHGVLIRGPTVWSGNVLLPKKMSNSQTLIKQKDEPFTDDRPLYEVSIAVIHPGSIGIRNSSTGNVSMDEPVGQEPHPSQHISGEYRSSEAQASLTERSSNCELANVPEGSHSSLEIASSTLGEVRISLTCNSAVGSPNFHKPTLDELIEVMEQRVLHDVKDIAKGQGIVIPWINEINNERLLPFHYISQNLVFQIACVNVSLYWIVDENCCSSCFGDCLSSAVVCACVRQSGKYVYSSEGLLEKEFLDECISMTQDPQQQCLLNCRCCPLEISRNEGIIEPCKVHLQRNIIKECWSKCGCHIQCGNRVVQRGINCKLQAFFTPDGKGWGLRTPEKLQKVAFVCEYVGEIVTVTELYERNTKNHNCPVLLDPYWASKGVPKDEEALCLEATCYGNVARCFDANLIEIPVEIESPEHHYYHVKHIRSSIFMLIVLSFVADTSFTDTVTLSSVFTCYAACVFTTRDVDAFEELIWDYGIDFDDHDHLSNAFQCRCGSKFFRNMKNLYLSIDSVEEGQAKILA